MMQFLRKHQKKLFLAIAVMTIVSFTFFGTYSTLNTREVSYQQVGKTIDGSAIYENDLKALALFLSMGPSEMLKSDLLETGAISLIAEKHFDEMQEEFQQRLQKAQVATFYSHPQAPFLNAQQVWSRFAPELLHHLREVQAGELSPKTFSTYAELYLDQQQFSPEILRMILLYEQRNYSTLSPDYTLADSRHLALFGYQSFEEWFGPHFSELLGKFILNTAAVAEKKGYQVSQKEARTDFMMACYQAARMKITRKEISSREATDFMHLQLQLAGVDESQAVKLWRKMMLVHRFFQDMHQGVLIDALPYEQFSTFADAKAVVDVYQLPQELQLRDFQSMLKVQYYLEAISPKGRQAVADLPRQFYSVEEVEKKHPELVISRYELEVAKVPQDEAASRVSLKQTWDFETSDEGWTHLVSQIPSLNKSGTEAKEGRLQVLDALDKNMRVKVDRLARIAILKAHPEWIEEALQSQKAESIHVKIRSRGAVAPFDDIEETESLRLALAKTPPGEVVSFKSPSESTYYQIKVVQKPAKPEIMTLQDALEHDWLGKLLDEKLEAALGDARKKDAGLYKTSSGSWKDFNEVKDHVGAYLYADFLKTLSSETLPYEEYACRRFEKMMQHAKKSIQAEQEASKFLSLTQQALVDQWKLIKNSQEIKRSDTTTLPKDELFSNELGNWSSIVTPKGGNVAFFQVLKREAANATIHDQVHDGQKLIGRDVTRRMIEALLDEERVL